MERCRELETAIKKIGNVRDKLNRSPLSEKLALLVKASKRSESEINGLRPSHRCELVDINNICSPGAEHAERIEKEFLGAVMEHFAQLFEMEATRMHSQYCYEGQHEKIAPANFGNSHYANKAFSNLEARLKADTSGRARQSNLLDKAAFASDAAQLIGAFHQIYGDSTNSGDAVKEQLNGLLVAESKHYGKILHHYEDHERITLIKEWHKSGLLIDRAKNAQAAAASFGLVGLAHYLQLSDYESFRNAVASLPIIRDLSTPLGIPAEFLLAAGMQLFAAKSIYNYYGVSNARSKAESEYVLMHWQQCLGEFMRASNGSNAPGRINKFASFANEEIYAKFSLPHETGILEFRIEGKKIIGPQGSVVYKAANEEEFKALEELFLTVRDKYAGLKGILPPLDERSPAAGKNCFNAERDIATYWLGGAFIQYQVKFFGGIRKFGTSNERVWSDAAIKRHQKALQEFYLSEQEKAKRVATLSPAGDGGKQRPDAGDLIDKLRGDGMKQASLTAQELQFTYEAKSAWFGTDHVIVRDSNSRVIGRYVAGLSADGSTAVLDLATLEHATLLSGIETNEVINTYKQMKQPYIKARGSPPVPTIMLYQPVRSPDANYIVVKDGAGNELAKLIHGKASALVLPANVFLPVDVLVDLGRNVVWDSRKTTTGKLPKGIDPLKVINVYKEQGWGPVTEFNQTREFKRNLTKRE